MKNACLRASHAAHLLKSQIMMTIISIIKWTVCGGIGLFSLWMLIWVLLVFNSKAGYTLVNQRLSDHYYRKDDTIHFAPQTELLSLFNATKLEGVDIQSFQVVAQKYAKDQKHVYYLAMPIAHAAPASFEIVAHPYAKDNAHVYYRSEKISQADPQTIDIISNVYSKDKNNVYFRHFKLKNVNPNTFALLPGMQAEEIEDSGVGLLQTAR